MKGYEERRCKFEQYFDVLAALNDLGTMPATRLMNIVHISWKQFQKILDDLISLEMIEVDATHKRGSGVILLPKGVEAFEGINKYLIMLGFEKGRKGDAGGLHRDAAVGDDNET